MVNYSNKLICPKCSVPLPKNVRFCTECGSKIEEDRNYTEEKQNSSNINNPVNIPYPDKQPIDDPIDSLKESSKDFVRDIGGFLNKASSSTRSQPQYCPNCSKALPYNVRFCTECGTSIVESTPPSEHVQNTVVNQNNEFNQLEYLEKLASLRDKGIISDEEFERKKKDILKI